APGFAEADTNRDSPRCAKNVIGPISRVAIISGQTPPDPAFMGRNRMPAPTAVPKSEIAQLFSKRRRFRDARLSSSGVESLAFIGASGSVGLSDITTLAPSYSLNTTLSRCRTPVVFYHA